VRFSAYSPSLPSCSDYYGGLGLPAFMTFLQDAPYGSHASTHGVIGAVFGCDLLDSYRASGLIVDEDSQLQICKKWGFYMKELYRADYIAPREDCSASSLTREGIDCGFVCNSDKYDDMLLEYVYENQGVLGKKGMTRDQVSFMQKRQFKTRINYKTNKQWPDAMAARTKGLRESTRMPVFDASQGPYLPDVVSGDIVSVVLLYLGPYSKPNNFFGNSWQLIGVQRLGHLERAETVDVEAQFQAFPAEAFPR
jgi:hypothetical protein